MIAIIVFQTILNFDNNILGEYLIFPDLVETKIYCLTIVLNFFCCGGYTITFYIQFGFVKVILSRYDILI